MILVMISFAKIFMISLVLSKFTLPFLKPCDGYLSLSPYILMWEVQKIIYMFYLFLEINCIKNVANCIFILDLSG